MYLMVYEARCPQCRKLLLRNLEGCADSWCDRCKREIRFDGQGGATVLDIRKVIVEN